MSAALVHRGPDSAGEHLDGPVALAARRLSIIDLAGGDQPIASEDGTCVVVQNGEIYNFPELRRELDRAGHEFRTRSDTEAIVHLYEEHGLDFARRLRGMFAIAIWDARRRRLVLARDRFGIKPLYYRHVGGELAFASELRALPRGEIDLDALEAFLAFNSIPAPYSIFRDIRKLPAGSSARLARGRPDRRRAVRAPRAGAARERARGRRGGAARGAARTAARLRPRAPARRRAGRRAALRRRRLGGARGARGGGERRARAHVHDRLRGAELRRARRRAPRRRAVRHRPPRAARPSRSDAAASGARRRVRRAVRRLVGTADVPRLGARGEPREGRALRRGRRRAVRRLLHVRSRSPRRAVRDARPARAPRGRAAADVDVEGELRLQGEALRPRRAPAAARTPPRLEGDLLRRRARRHHRAQRRVRPGGRVPRALPRDRRRRRARAPPGRRLRRSTSSTTCS